MAEADDNNNNNDEEHMESHPFFVQAECETRVIGIVVFD